MFECRGVPMSGVDTSQDDMQIVRNQESPVSFLGATAIVFISIGILAIGSLIFGFDVGILLLFVCMFTTTVYTYYYDFSWDEMLEKGAVPMMSRGIKPVLILLTIGILIGSWMISGTIPYLMYLGLQFLSPSIFFASAVIILSVGALVTGTSWGAGATFGVALMGVARGLDLPLAPAAGAIVMGAYFGDKMSPISDTTILASAIAEDDLIDHIRSMFYTTLPGYVLGLIVFIFLGQQLTISNVQTQNVSIIIQTLQQTFSLSPILLVPPLVLIIFSYLRYPTIPVLWVSILLAVPLSLYQGYAIADIVTVMASGPDITTQVDTLNDLLSRGGITQMAGIIVILFFAFLLAGQLQYTNSLQAIISALREKFIGDSTGKLVFATSVTGLLTAAGTGNGQLSEIIPGISFKETFDEFNIDRTVLSRTLEDSGTVWEPLIPWSAAGLYFSQLLGVPTLAYAPWAVMCYTGFILAWIYAFTDTFIFKSEVSADKGAAPTD